MVPVVVGAVVAAAAAVVVGVGVVDRRAAEKRDVSQGSIPVSSHPSWPRVTCG